jgi:hypothetical protein
MKKTIILFVLICAIASDAINAQQLPVGIINTTATADTVILNVYAGSGNALTTVITRRFQHGTNNVLDSTLVYMNGSTSIDTFNVYYIPNSPDTFDYSVCLINMNWQTGCSDKTSIATLNTTGIGSFETILPFVISVSPNPTDYKSRITFPDKAVGKECTIVNSMGQKVRWFKAKEEVIFYKEDLPAGIYFLLIDGSAKAFVLR